MMLLALAVAAAAAPAECGARNTQTDMNICFGARAKQADAALNVSWRKLMAVAGASKPSYLAAQRLWLQYRKAECDAEGQASLGGSIHASDVAGCLADLTEARTKRIDQLADQPR